MKFKEGPLGVLLVILGLSVVGLLSDDGCRCRMRSVAAGLV